MSHYLKFPALISILTIPLYAEGIPLKVEDWTALNSVASGSEVTYELQDSFTVAVSSDNGLVNNGATVVYTAPEGKTYNLSITGLNQKDTGNDTYIVPEGGNNSLLNNATGAHTGFQGLGTIDFSLLGGTSSSYKRFGSIYLNDSSSLSFSDNATVNLSQNALQSQSSISSTQELYGGVIYATKAVGNVSFERNGQVMLRDNRLQHNGAYGSARGGAYYSANASSKTGITLSFSGNGAVDISSNKISGGGNTSGGGPSGQGGALWLGKWHNLTIAGNTGYVSLSDNKVVMHNGADGGAVYANAAMISIDSNTGLVSINRNSVENTSESSGTVSGGAFRIQTYSSGYDPDKIFYSTSISDNTQGVEIKENYAKTANSSAQGGAIHTASNTRIDRNGGKVQLCGNYVASTSTKANDTGNLHGGAIYTATTTDGAYLSISNNGEVLVKGNYVSSEKNGYKYAKGGAFYMNSALHIEGNDDVIFQGNYVRTGDSVRLNSIERNSSYNYTNPQLVLAAKTGKKIEFRDTVRMLNSNATVQNVSFNNQYTDASGTTRQAGGSIVFTGEYTESDLKASRAAHNLYELTGIELEAAVQESRTSTIQADVTLHNGTLSVEHGAILSIYDLAVKTGATLSLTEMGMLSAREINLESGAALHMQNASVGMASAPATTLTYADNASAEISGINTINTESIISGAGCEFALTLSAANQEAALLSLVGVEMLQYDAASVHFDGLDKLAAGRYMVLDVSGTSKTAVDFSDDPVNVTGLMEGDSFEWNAEGNVLYLVHVNVPEPTVPTLGLIALSFLSLRRRRN